MEQAKKASKSVLRGFIITGVVFLLTVALFGLGASAINSKSDEEQAEALEESVRRSVVLYYAIEGRYPSSVEELKENYGLRYNEDQFIVSIHSNFTDNLLPDIFVMPVGGENE
ncbi:MAG: hypothetical protein J6K72_00955 [Clostridia bacterium]|nr:hypothetical protein [Clostridia bacterium]